MVEAGFEPYIFDRAISGKGIDSISYNYGAGGLNPKYQVLITRRIQEAFQAAGERLDLALIEFCPFQETKVRNRVTAFIDDQYVATLASNKELFDITLADPTTGIRLFNIRYLRAGISAELLTTGMTREINEELTDRLSEAYLAARRRTNDLSRQLRASVRKDVPDFTTSPWDRRLRGGLADKTKLSERSIEILRDLMASRRHPEFLEADLRRRIDEADILDLGFDQQLLDAFVQMVRNFQSFSEHVEVILLPRNTDWVNYTPAVRARLDAALQAITDQTDVVIRDYQVHPKIGPEHFLDTTHLSLYDGLDIFTKILAEDYAEVLRD